MCESANVPFFLKEDRKISEWAEDKGDGGNGQRDEEEERKRQKRRGRGEEA